MNICHLFTPLAAKICLIFQIFRKKLGVVLLESSTIYWQLIRLRTPFPSPGQVISEQNQGWFSWTGQKISSDSKNYHQNVDKGSKNHKNRFKNLAPKELGFCKELALSFFGLKELEKLPKSQMWAPCIMILFHSKQQLSSNF